MKPKLSISLSALAAVAIAGGVLYSVPAAVPTDPLAPANPSLRTHQIRVVYEVPTDEKHQPIYQALQERRVLEMLRSVLNSFRLPRQLTLELKSCGGTVDAYYGDDTATVCYEYVELIQRHAPKVGTPGGLTRVDSIIGAVVDTFLHEVGHAVIEMLEVPVFGREEDAADFFSAYVLLQFTPEDAARLFQGVGFMMASEAKAALEKPQGAKSFAGQHGMAPQRYYNLLCMAYGSDPKTFADAITKGGLPQERAEGCDEEFEMLDRAFRKLVLPYVDAALLTKARSEVRFNWGPLIPSTDGLDALPLAD